MRHLDKVRVKQKAAEVYGTFTESERKAVQFGLFPHAKTVKAERELAAEFGLTDDEAKSSDLFRLLAVGMMDAANSGKDKVLV